MMLSFAARRAHSQSTPSEVAPECATDQEFQTAFFDMFSTTLRNAPVYPVLSNHDTAGETNPAPTIPYFENLSLPSAGEAGGVPSGTEKYYSFDYGNIHFVCLDTQASDRSPTSPMVQWLRKDLEANRKHWLIVMAGNPPYGTIGNDSDTKAVSVEVRENILPILEENGLDLYLAGDDHAYERSFLLDGHYGLSNSLTGEMILDAGGGRPEETGAYNKLVQALLPHRGAVYVVNGASSHLDEGTNRHPAMFITRQVLGSMLLEVTDRTLSASYVTAEGVVEDRFSIIKPKYHNFPPTAEAGAASTFEERATTVALRGADLNREPIGFELVALPEGGELRLGGEEGELLGVGRALSWEEAQSITYVPRPDYSGTDLFMFAASDGVQVSLSPGRHELTLTVSDPRRASGTDGVTVTIADTEPPVMTCPEGVTTVYEEMRGAVVFFEALAVDVCDGDLEVTCTPASGSVFPIGLNRVVCSAADQSGNVAMCGFPVNVSGPRGVHRAVFGELVDLYLGAAGGDDRDRLSRAISPMVGTLDPNLWVDETHLSEEGGRRVFAGDTKVASALMEILATEESEVPKQAVERILDWLSAAARLLAEVAIEEEAAAGAAPARVTGDLAELGKGDADAALGRYEKAIEHYGRAWSRSIRLRIRLVQDLVRLEFAGDGAGGHTIESSTDLIHWEPAGEGSVREDGTVVFDAPVGSGDGSRFFRVARRGELDAANMLVDPEVPDL